VRDSTKEPNGIFRGNMMSSTTSESRGRSRLARLLAATSGFLKTGPGTVLQVLVLAALVWAAYGNGLHGPFVFDDWHVIRDNPAVRGPADIPSFFVDTTKFSILKGNRDYRPLFLTSMALCWWAGGGKTLPFHLVSVTIHMVNVLLLFFVLRLMFSRWLDPVGGLSEWGRRWGAFIAAALFAVHPLATQSVNYISSQSVPMAALFYLLAFLLFLLAWAREGALTGPARWVLIAGSCLAYFLALLGKPIAVTFPLVLLIWEGSLGGTVWQRRSGLTGNGQWRRLLKHLPYWGITLAYLIMRKTVSPQAFGDETPFRPPISHYLTETKALVFYYLKLALWPLGLNVDREYPVSDSLFEWKVLAAILVLVAAAVVIYRFRRHGNLVFWSLWFPACLLVTTYIVILGQVVNEHRVYLSLAGLCALAGLLLVRLWEALPVRFWDSTLGSRSGKVTLGFLIILALAALAWGTVARNRVWSTEFSLWENAVLNQGTFRAHMNYGLALEAAGRAEEALAEFEKAVEMKAGSYPLINLGLAYLRRGREDEALAKLEAAVRQWEDLPEGHLYLARGLKQVGRTEEAEKELRRAIELRPDYMKAWRNLARFLEEEGRTSETLAAYRRLQELDPGKPWIEEKIRRLVETGSNLALQIQRAIDERGRGDLDRALAILERARPYAPAEPDVLFNLAFTHQRRGDRAEAIALYEELLEVAPEHLHGLFNLAYAYRDGSSRGEWTRSAELFAQVVELEPARTEAVSHLATVLWKLGREEEAVRYDRLFLEKGGHADLMQRSRDRLAGRTAE